MITIKTVDRKRNEIIEYRRIPLDKDVILNLSFKAAILLGIKGEFKQLFKFDTYLITHGFCGKFKDFADRIELALDEGKKIFITVEYKKCDDFLKLKSYDVIEFYVR